VCVLCQYGVKEKKVFVHIIMRVPLEFLFPSFIARSHELVVVVGEPFLEPLCTSSKLASDDGSC